MRRKIIFAALLMAMAVVLLTSQKSLADELEITSPSLEMTQTSENSCQPDEAFIMLGSAFRGKAFLRIDQKKKIWSGSFNGMGIDFVKLCLAKGHDYKFVQREGVPRERNKVVWKTDELDGWFGLGVYRSNRNMIEFELSEGGVGHPYDGAMIYHDHPGL